MQILILFWFNHGHLVMYLPYIAQINLKNATFKFLKFIFGNQIFQKLQLKHGLIAKIINIGDRA